MNISIKTGRVSFNAEEVQDMHGSLKRARDILDAFEKGLNPAAKKFQDRPISFDIFTFHGYKTTVCAATPEAAKVWAAQVYGGHAELYQAVVTK